MIVNFNRILPNSVSLFVKIVDGRLHLFLFSLFYFIFSLSFNFYFLFLEQLGLGVISHAVTSVTN